MGCDDLKIVRSGGGGNFKMYKSVQGDGGRGSKIDEIHCTNTEYVLSSSTQSSQID